MLAAAVGVAAAAAAAGKLWVKLKAFG